MTEEKKTEKRRKRLRGVSLGELRVAMKALRTAMKALDQKQNEIADAHGVFKRQINWSNFIIYDLDIVTPEGKPDEKARTEAVPVGKLTPEQVKSIREPTAAVNEADEKVGDLRWEYAEKLGCLPDDINPNTGEITGGPVDYVDPDEEMAKREALAEKAADAINSALEELDEIIDGTPAPVETLED